MPVVIHCFECIRFGDNFALFEDEGSDFGVSVVWIVKGDAETASATASVNGHKFRDMKPSWEDDRLSFAVFHSYRVSRIEEEGTTWPLKKLVGKGTCMFIGVDDDFLPTTKPAIHTVESIRTPNVRHHWVFDLLDHCVDYTRVVPKRKRKAST